MADTHHMLLDHFVFSTKNRKPYLQPQTQFNDQRFSLAKFGWQDGYGVFTVSPSQKDAVIRYIENQALHHAKEDFQTEYLRLLEKHGVEYDPKYLWD